MSTTEELFLQIFERKKWIIDQVKQQSDLFDQYLASNCLINGIQPPPWLLSSKGTTQFRGLPFLPPKPNNVAQTTTRPPFPGKIPQDSNTLPKTTCSLDKGCLDVGGDGSKLVSTSSLETVLESNHAISSPVRTQPRVLGTDLHLDQSLARIQRSKSRQKALELRNSVEVKSAKENHTTAFPDITSSPASVRHSKLAKENSDRRKLENSTDGGCFRSRGLTPVSYQINSADNTLRSSDIVDGENEILKDQLRENSCRSSVLVQPDKLLGGNTDDKISSKVHMRDACCGNIMMSQTDPQASEVGCVNELLQLGKSEEHPSGRAITRSRSSASKKFSQLGAQGNIIEGRDPVQASDAHLITVLDNGQNDDVYMEKCDVGVADNDVDSDLPAEACLNCVKSNLVSSSEAKGFSVLNPLPDANILVEPKQLFFDDEDCALNNTPKQPFFDDEDCALNSTPKQLDDGVSTLTGKGTPAEKEKGHSSPALVPSESIRKIPVYSSFRGRYDEDCALNGTPNQLFFDVEDYALNSPPKQHDDGVSTLTGKRTPAEEEKGNKSPELAPSDSIRELPVYSSFRGRHDAHPQQNEQNSDLTNRGEELSASPDTCENSDLAVNLELKEGNDAFESVGRESEQRASSRSCDEARLQSREGGSCCDFCPALSSDEILYVSALSSKKEPSETVGGVLADVSPGSYKILKQEALEPPKKLVTLDNTFGQRGLTVDVEVEERNHTLEVVDKEEERRTSYELCKKGMLEFTDEGAECNSHPSLSCSKVFNASTLSKVKSETSKQLGKLTPEIQGTVVVNTYSGKKSIPRIGCSPSDHLMFLKDGRSNSAGSQLQGDVNQMEASLSKTFDQKLDVGAAEVSSKICKPVSIADDLQKSINHDLDPVICLSGHNEHEVLSREQETEYVGAAGGGNRSILTQVITPKSAQISNMRQEVSSLPSNYIKHDENDGFSRSDGSSFETSFINSRKTVHNAYVDSWPPYKRRKVEARSSDVFTTATRLTTVEPLHQIDENGISRSHRHEDGLTASLECKHDISSSGAKASQSNIIEKLDAGICGREKHSKTDVSSPSLQATKDDGVMKGGEKDTKVCTVFRQPWVDGTLDSNWNENEFGNASELSGSTDISLTQLASEVHQNASFHQSKLNLQTVKEMSSTEEIPQDMEFVDEEELLSYHPVTSPNAEDLDLIVAKESMPELERFTINMSAEENMSLSSDKLCLSNIDLPTTTEERVSILEILCKSASKVTPLPQSSKHKNHIIPDICQSLPNGLLERMDPRNGRHFSNEDFKELKASYNFLSSTPNLASYSGCMPTSCVQFDFGIRKPPDTPHPVRMLGQKFASVPARHSFEKQQSVNPELTCFRIDEDSNSSEDGNLLDEVVDMSHKGISPRESDNSSLRRPLVDMTNSRPLPSLSGTKNVHDRSSTDSVNTESYMHRTRTSDKQKLRNTCGSNRKAKKDKRSQSSLMSGNVVGKASKSSYNMSPKLLRKPSEGNKSQSFVDKGYKPANIVSNVSSFIPSVQQKQQPAAFAAGKRDVKVKALEAAEAAKRLEEKRENDRRMKKEAAKLERARLEEEKGKQLVLRQKEEREKQEADMAARKRLREVKDRKEKVKKRKCIEDLKRQQKEQDKFRVEKEEKKQRHKYADEKEGKQNDLLHAEQKHPKAEKGSQIAESRIRAETGTTVAVEDAIEVRSDLCEENNCDFLFSEARGDHSYQISPYQASDNEEEEEQDAIPNKKFVPSWAREKYLASVMPLMQQVDPYTIFPSTRVCNISQVLLPRACSK